MVPCLEQQFSDHLIRYFPKIFLLLLIATIRARNTVVSISQFAHEHFFETLYSLVDIRADDQKVFKLELTLYRGLEIFGQEIFGRILGLQLSKYFQPPVITYKS